MTGRTLPQRPLDPEQPRLGSRTLAHVPALDGLRGIAVLLVMGFHAMVLFDQSEAKSFLRGGFLGVQIFFTLSGFLITSLLLNEQSQTGKVAFGGFYRRRAFRLLPALFVLLTVHALYTVMTGLPIRVEMTSIIALVFYVANWVMFAHRPFTVDLQHLWSLSVEEQFYFVWPLITVAYLGSRRSLRFVSCVLCTAIVALAIWRTMLWKDGTTLATLGPIWTRTDANADALLVGALAAYIWTRGRTPRRGLPAAGWLSVLLIGICALWVPQLQGFYYKGGFTLIALGTATIILGVVERPARLAVALSTPPLRIVGRVSYGLYLWHVPVFYAVLRYGKTWSPIEQATAGLIITAAVVTASWHFVEQPFLRRSHRARAASRTEG